MSNMRDILFRGKRKDTGEWVEGYYVITDPIDMPSRIRKPKALIFPTNGMCNWFYKYFRPVEVLPETVGQFTGLTGKNGVKIFEGDVVQIHSRSSVNGEVMAVIAFHHGCFGYAYIDYDPDDDDNECPAFDASYNNEDHLAQYAHNFIKVIGNIHDNPELLEVGQNGTLDNI